MTFGSNGLTIDELMRILEECGQDQPVVIETVAHGDITPYEFDSFFDVRSSREYTGSVFLDIDPEIWYETRVASIWRDEDWFDGKVIITLEDIDEEV